MSRSSACLPTRLPACHAAGPALPPAAPPSCSHTRAHRTAQLPATAHAALPRPADLHAPTGVTATGLKGLTHVTWVPPTSGTTPTYYQVLAYVEAYAEAHAQMARSATFNVRATAGGSGPGPYSVALQLPPGTYRLRVRSADAVSSGQASQPSAAVTIT